MADYGALIDVNGNPFITPDSTPFCLYRKLTADSVANGSYQTATVTVPLDDSYPAIAFSRVRNTDYGGVALSTGRVGGMFSAGGINPFNRPFTMDVYVFAIFPQTLPKWGMAIWDAAGKLVLTNESRVLSDLQTIGTPGNNGGINIDQTLPGSLAVAPLTMGGTLLQNNNTQPPSIVFVQAYTCCWYNGSTSRINAAANNAGNGGGSVGTTNSGVAITAINTANYD